LNRQVPQDVDVLFYGSIGPRRKRVLDALASRGLQVKTLFGVYGAERDRWIERSKLVLNMHHYDTGIFEIVRVFYLLTNAVPVVGEVNESTVIDPFFRDAVAAVDYAHLVDTCATLARDEDARQALALRGRQRLESRPQSSFFQPLLMPAVV
jgi:hypothetical protein